VGNELVDVRSPRRPRCRNSSRNGLRRASPPKFVVSFGTPRSGQWDDDRRSPRCGAAFVTVSATRSVSVSAGEDRVEKMVSVRATPDDAQAQNHLSPVCASHVDVVEGVACMSRAWFPP
jgi:hypothetical protein